MATIEYVYSAHSAFAYLGSARFMEIARTAGRTVLHRPVDLRRVVDAAGATPFGRRGPRHRDYYFRREIERWAELRGAPVLSGIPTHHANDTTLPNCLLIAAAEHGHDAGPLAHAMLQAHWRDDADLADADTLAGLARGVGLAAAALLAAAGSSAIRTLYERYTEEAIRRSVFGSPSYFADGDMFYGQDRLELLERALRQPFAGVRWLDSPSLV